MISKYLSRLALLCLITIAIVNAQSSDGWIVSYSEMDSVRLTIVSPGIEGNYCMRIQCWSNNSGAVFRMRKSFGHLAWSNDFSFYLYKSVLGSGSSAKLGCAKLIFGNAAASTQSRTFIDGSNSWQFSGNGGQPYSAALSGIDTIEIEVGFFHGQGYTDFYVDELQETADGEIKKIDSFGDYGKVAGNIFADLNSNGLEDSSDFGLSGWKIQAFKLEDSSFVGQAISGSSGNYQFSGIERARWKDDPNDSLPPFLSPWSYFIVSKRASSDWEKVSADTVVITFASDALDTVVNFSYHSNNIATIAYEQRWNLVSLPSNPTDKKSSDLFPGAASSAYFYNDGYVVAESLQLGKGYWLKFSSSQSVYFTGEPVMQETVAVNAGWNLVGALSMPIATSSISSIPTMALSSFFGFNNGYKTVDTLFPGYGYWVKGDRAGMLLLLGSNTGNTRLFKRKE